MEYSRKKMSDENLNSIENGLFSKADLIFDEYKPLFEKIGYEFELEIYSENDKTGETGVREERCEYANGYTSYAVFRVLKPVQTEIPEELYQNSEDGEAPLSEEEIQVNRRIAYTSISLVRIYKSFWSESVIIDDNFDSVRADLDEFLQKLSETQPESDILDAEI